LAELYWLCGFRTFLLLDDFELMPEPEVDAFDPEDVFWPAVGRLGLPRFVVSMFCAPDGLP
jgi:hypothetical protein